MLGILSMKVNAHEMTPTYPKLKSSHVDGVYTTQVELFNKREDVEYYDIGVFDKDFNHIRFVTVYDVYKVEYLGRIKVDIFVNGKDVPNVEYICSISRMRRDSESTTLISSKICSRVKK
jgi:hypothetical protein